MPTTSDSPSETGEGNSRPEILFYHLEQSRLMQVLPSLLEKTLQRGWRAVVQADTRKQVDDLNNNLWTSSDDSFLPHGASDDGYSDEQPIYLTETTDNPNKAAIRFFVDGAQPGDIAGYERIVYLFDGHNEEQVANARQQWKRLVADGGEATYWRQNERGGWEKKA
jgi:DNA polymerase III subunit chi